MTRILPVGVALPEHVHRQPQVRDAMARWLEGRVDNPERVLALFARAGVDKRYTVDTLDEVFTPRTFEERNNRYIETGIELALDASRTALARAGVASERIDLVASVSCTGFMIPSVDAHLANRLPLHARVRRLPITELGCAAGLMATSHVADLLDARPHEVGLLVGVELPSLCFQLDDFSMDHLVSCALFGDGAAAIVLAGDDSDLVRRWPTAPRVVHHATSFMHDTIGAMGFRVAGSGFHMVLDKTIPDLLDAHLAPAMEAFVAEAGLTLGDVDHFLVHPGGRKIIDRVEAIVGRGPRAVRFSRRVLESYGNLSSVSVLLLLHEFFEAGVARPGERALMVAFGPGFNAELLLLEWPGAC